MNAAGRYTAEVGGDAFSARGIANYFESWTSRVARRLLNCPDVGATPGPRAWYSRFDVPC